jgi:hypothetical protein
LTEFGADPLRRKEAERMPASRPNSPVAVVFGTAVGLTP